MTALAQAGSPNRVLANTFLAVALSMIPTVAGVFMGFSLIGAITASPGISLTIYLALSLLLLLCVYGFKESFMGLIFLFCFAFVVGTSMSVGISHSLALKGPEHIALAVAGTGLILFVMSGVAMTTKTDFTFLGSWLFSLLIAVIILSLANVFIFHLPGMSLAISIFSMILFSVYVLVDVQDVVNGNEDNYIVAACGIYLDIVNLFMNLLNILDLSDS